MVEKHLQRALVLSLFITACISSISAKSFASDDFNFAIEPPKEEPKPIPVTNDDPMIEGFDGSKITFGYPRFDGGASINPGVYSLTQTLKSVGTKFNFSGFNVLDLNVGARAFFTPNLIATIDIRAHSVTVAAADLVTYQLLSSSVTAISANTAINYCTYLGSTEKKICPGITISYDNYPILKFATNTNLTLAKLGDMSVGPNVLFMAPVGDNLTARARAGYNFGLKQGSTSGFTMNSDSNFFVTADMLYPVSPKLWAAFGLGVFSQSANFTSTVDKSQWDMSNLSYIVNLGVRYNFNFLN